METPSLSNTEVALHDARERVSLRVQSLVDEAAELLKNAQRAGQSQLASTRDKLASQLRAARAELAQLEEDALVQARRVARATDEAVHEHPYVAIGFAAGAGLLIGLLLGRRD